MLAYLFLDGEYNKRIDSRGATKVRMCNIKMDLTSKLVAVV